jgi:hypothetical protein
MGNATDQELIVEKWISEIPLILNHDVGVGIYVIINKGRHVFGLKGDDLVDFTRKSLLALFDAGAVPISASGTGAPWKLDRRYGMDKDEIIERVIRQWLVETKDDPGVDAIWFGTPEED